MAGGGRRASRLFGRTGRSGARLALCVAVGLGASVATKAAASDQPKPVPTASLEASGSDALPIDAPSESAVIAAPVPVRPPARTLSRDERGGRGLLLLLLMRQVGAGGPFAALRE
jgi:hypothetical protein